MSIDTIDLCLTLNSTRKKGEIMKINENGRIFMGEDSRSERMENGTDKEGRGIKNGNMFAGDLNIIKDPVVQKIEEAKKQAMCIVSDTFTSERKIDDDLQSRRDKVNDLGNKIKQAEDQINEINKSKDELKEIYNVLEDSDEQKDLELLEKRNESKNNPDITFTDEEMERLAKIDEEGMTEYQQRALELEKSKDIYNEQIEESKKEVLKENLIIRGIRLERLKDTPMLDATQQKDAIMEAAYKEVIDILREEVKDHLDEVAQEEKEKAEEKAEERKEEEEVIENIQEKIEELEKLSNPEKAEEKKTKEEDSDIYDKMEDLLEMGQLKNDVQKKAENIVSNMKLVTEDLKGIKVDEWL